MSPTLGIGAGLFPPGCKSCSFLYVASPFGAIGVFLSCCRALRTLPTDRAARAASAGCQERGLERDGPAHREGGPSSSVSWRCAQSSAAAQEHAYRSEGGRHVQEATRPGGNNPAPIPRVGNKELYQAPHFKVDVVRSALSSFGPGSAAGLLGYKPYLLQQGMRSESAFEGAVTSAVNHLAAGKAPRFLKRILAGGVSHSPPEERDRDTSPGVR